MLSPDQSFSLQCCTASFVPCPVRTSISRSCLPYSQSYQWAAQTSWRAQNIHSWPPAMFPACTKCLKQSSPCPGHSLIFLQRCPSQAPTFSCRQIFQKVEDGCLPTALLRSSCREGIQVRCEDMGCPQPKDSCLYLHKKEWGEPAFAPRNSHHTN